jgi:hypothetical protein
VSFDQGGYIGSGLLYNTSMLLQGEIAQIKVYQSFIAVDELEQDNWLYGVASNTSGTLAFSSSSVALA